MSLLKVFRICRVQSQVELSWKFAKLYSIAQAPRNLGILMGDL